MASKVDSSFPADNVKVSKSSFRAQMVIIKSELEEVQRKVRLAWKIAIGDQSV